VYYIDHQRRNWNILSRRERKSSPRFSVELPHTSLSSFTSPLIEGLDMLLYLLQTLLQSRRRAKRNPHPKKKVYGRCEELYIRWSWKGKGWRSHVQLYRALYFSPLSLSPSLFLSFFSLGSQTLARSPLQTCIIEGKVFHT
jgi:hypothetical protein